MNDTELVTTSHALPENRPLQRTLKLLKRLGVWLLRMFALLLAGFILYFWTALSPRALVQFDRTGLDPGEPDFGRPIDYAATLSSCLGPPGWFVALGVFTLALVMALAVYRWPWPLRVILAATPPALIMYHVVTDSDLFPWARQFLLQFTVVALALAMLAALLCGPIARRLLRWWRAGIG